MNALLDLQSALLPWQMQAWQQLCARLESGTLPHALLVSGVAGTGKERFARASRVAGAVPASRKRACLRLS